MNEGPPRIAWLAANATVFTSSFCVMVVELVAGRIISSHLGSSIYTWTSVIGVILAGLALGNYLGGRLADRYPPRPLLSLLFVVSSATCVAITVGNNLVGSWGFLWDLAWPARVASHVALVFFLPAALLGTVGPVVAAAALTLGGRTGRTLGSVYAWGVVGSIVGTFATGYLLIDRMGTTGIIWSVAAVLAVTGLCYMPRSIGSWGWSAVLVFAFVLATSPWAWARSTGEQLALRPPEDPSVLYRDESLYSRVEVRKISEDGDLRGMYLDKLLHSKVSMRDPFGLHYDYSKIFAELTHLRLAERTGPRTLTIGGGGYVFPRYLESTWPGSVNDVVEIDPAVTRAAHEAFGLPRDTSIRSFHTDGRVFVHRMAERRLAGERTGAYDFVYLDAVNDYSVPYQLTTVEFFREVESLLEPEGLLLVNCIDILDSGLVIGALAGTVGEVFPEVEVFTLGGHERMRGDSRLTFVLAASRSPLSWAPNGDGGVARLADERVERYTEKAGIVLADEFSPVETLLSPVVLASSREAAAGDALATALSHAAAGDDESYVRYALEALRRDPRFAAAHFNLGVGLYRTNRRAEGIDHWRQALRIDPSYAEAHFNLGAALYAEKRYSEARAHLLEATRLRPGTARFHIAAGVVLEAAGQIDGALHHLTEALRIDPGSIEARGHLSRIRPGRAVASRGGDAATTR